MADAGVFLHNIDSEPDLSHWVPLAEVYWAIFEVLPAGLYWGLHSDVTLSTWLWRTKSGDDLLLCSKPIVTRTMAYHCGLDRPGG